MKIFYQIKTIVVICVFFLSCSQNKVKSLKEVDSIVVKGANSEVFKKNYYILRYFCIDEKYYIANVDENKKNIYLTNASDSKIVHTIFTPDNFSLFRTFDFDIISFDSIVYYNEHTKSVIIADAAGNVNFKTQLDLGDLETYPADEYVISSTPFSNRIHFHNNLFVNHYPVQNVSDKQVRKEYYSKKQLLEIDVYNNKVLNYFISFPEYYQTEEFKIFNPYTIFFKATKRFVYTFDNDPLIYIEDSTGIKTVLCKSQLHKDARKYDETMLEKSDRTYDRKYFTVNSSYASIHYNEIQKVYYRIYCIPKPYKNEDGTINLPRDRDFVVMKLDTNFKIIDEYFFDRKLYDTGMFTLTNDGFLLRKKTENPDDDYVFARFKTE